MPHDTIALLIPVFDDWVACRALLARLDDVLSPLTKQVSVIVVDDGSHETPVAVGDFSCLRLTLVRLRRNLGHQRAICVGLTYVHSSVNPDVTVVMDSDGEDRPEDVPRLLAQAEAAPGSIVFAKRTKRSESLMFRVGYQAFRLLHRLSTGHDISFGNFSAIPRVRLASLLSVSDLWNNYAASVIASRQRYCSVPAERGSRLAGQPHMNVVALVAHGLGALSVFGETVSIRLAVVGVLAGLLAVVLVLLGVSNVVPMSLPSLVVAIIVTVASLQLIAFALLFAFMTLSRRSAAGFMPIRDAAQFIEHIGAWPRATGEPVRTPVP